jgi:hypothetical protein
MSYRNEVRCPQIRIHLHLRSDCSTESEHFMCVILRREVTTLFRGLGPEKVAPSGPQKSEARIETSACL